MKRKDTTQSKAESLRLDFEHFKKAGFTAEEAKEWRNAGFGFRSAPEWRNAGFTAEEAQAWRDIGPRDNPVLPTEAAGAKRRGETPETYRRNRNRTYPHPMQTR